MTVVTLEEAKAHLRVDGSDDDADIQLKLAAAEEDVAGRIGRPLPWQDDTGADVPVPFAVKAAILLVLGDLYANREGAIVGTIHTVNPTVDRLLSRFCEWTIG